MNLLEMLKLYHHAPYVSMVIITVLLVLVLLCGWKAPRWVKSVGSIALVFAFVRFDVRFVQRWQDVLMAGDIAPSWIAYMVNEMTVPLIYGLLVYAVARIICMIQTRTWVRSTGTIILVTGIVLSLFAVIRYLNWQCWTVDEATLAYDNWFKLVVEMLSHALNNSYPYVLIGGVFYGVTRVMELFRTARI